MASPFRQHRAQPRIDFPAHLGHNRKRKHAAAAAKRRVDELVPQYTE